MNVNDLATSVHEKAKKEANDNNYTFDIVTIMTIANIIIQLIKLIKELRNSDEEVAEELRSMGPLRKIALRWMIFRKVKRSAERKTVYEGIRDSFKGLDKDTVLELVREQK